MPYKDKEKAREYNRRWRLNHKVNGLCVHCNQPHLGNSTYCLFHLYKTRTEGSERYRNNSVRREQVKIRTKERYNKCKTEHRCYYCAMPLDEESRMGLECLTCYSKRKGYI